MIYEEKSIKNRKKSCSNWLKTKSMIFSVQLQLAVEFSLDILILILLVIEGEKYFTKKCVMTVQGRKYIISIDSWLNKFNSLWSICVF